MKMSDVFTLPIDHKMIELYSPEGEWESHCKIDTYAAHAINCHDELVAILDKVITTQAKHYGDGMGLHLAMIPLARELEAITQKARGEA